MIRVAVNLDSVPVRPLVNAHALLEMKALIVNLLLFNTQPILLNSMTNLVPFTVAHQSVGMTIPPSCSGTPLCLMCSLNRLFIKP